MAPKINWVFRVPEDYLAEPIGQCLIQMQRVGKSMVTLGTSLSLLITGPLVSMASAAANASLAHTAAMNAIARTGAQGDDLRALGAVMDQVRVDTHTGLGDAAIAVADFHQRLGLTGDALRDVSDAAVRLARATGSDVNATATSVSQLMRAWNVDAKDVPAALASLTGAARVTSGGIAALAAQLTAAAPVFKEAGIPLGDAAQMLSELVLAGISADDAIAGLRIALTKLAKEQVGDIGEALRGHVAAIRNAGSQMEAAQLGADLFGRRSLALVDAIRRGALAFGAVAQQGAPDLPLDTAGRLAQAFEDLTVQFDQRVLQPLGDALLRACGPLFDIGMGLMDGLLSGLTTVTRWFSSLSPGAREAIIVLAGLAAAVGPALLVLTEILIPLGTMLAAGVAFLGSGGLIAGAVAALAVGLGAAAHAGTATTERASAATSGLASVSAALGSFGVTLSGMSGEATTANTSAASSAIGAAAGAPRSLDVAGYGASQPSITAPRLPSPPPFAPPALPGLIAAPPLPPPPKLPPLQLPQGCPPPSGGGGSGGAGPTSQGGFGPLPAIPITPMPAGGWMNPAFDMPGGGWMNPSWGAPAGSWMNPTAGAPGAGDWMNPTWTPPQFGPAADVTPWMNTGVGAPAGTWMNPTWTPPQSGAPSTAGTWMNPGWAPGGILAPPTSAGGWMNPGEVMGPDQEPMVIHVNAPPSSGSNTGLFTPADIAKAAQQGFEAGLAQLNLPNVPDLTGMVPTGAPPPAAPAAPSAPTPAVPSTAPQTDGYSDKTWAATGKRLTIAEAAAMGYSGGDGHDPLGDPPGTLYFDPSGVEIWPNGYSTDWQGLRGPRWQNVPPGQHGSSSYGLSVIVVRPGDPLPANAIEGDLAQVLVNAARAGADWLLRAVQQIVARDGEQAAAAAFATATGEHWEDYKAEVAAENGPGNDVYGNHVNYVPDDWDAEAANGLPPTNFDESADNPVLDTANDATVQSVLTAADPIVADTPQPGDPTIQMLPTELMSTLKGWLVTKVASFTVSGLVLSATQYSQDTSWWGDLAPVDLAMGWGQMADPRFASQFRVSQHNSAAAGRGYSISGPPSSIYFARRLSDNMHMIPANDEIGAALAATYTGQQVQFSGFLVKASGPKGSLMSSLLLDDSDQSNVAAGGNGACEIVLVDSFRNLGTGG